MGSINDPVSPFPKGQKPADESKPPRGGKGKAKKAEPDETEKLIAFIDQFEALDEEGRSAQSPEAVESQAREAGLDPASIAVIMQLVTTYGPQVIGGIKSLINLFRKK